MQAYDLTWLIGSLGSRYIAGTLSDQAGRPCRVLRGATPETVIFRHPFRSRTIQAWQQLRTAEDSSVERR
ncbi:MAG: hypothetical protein ACOYLF_08785 [Blastocatellia bacterium]